MFEIFDKYERLIGYIRLSIDTDYSPPSEESPCDFFGAWLLAVGFWVIGSGVFYFLVAIAIPWLYGVSVHPAVPNPEKMALLKQVFLFLGIGVPVGIGLYGTRAMYKMEFNSFAKFCAALYLCTWLTIKRAVLVILVLALMISILVFVFFLVPYWLAK